MKKPSIYDFQFPLEVGILKNLAYLKHKEKHEELTPQERNMLYETYHNHELCMHYKEIPSFRPLFTGVFELPLNFYGYIESIIQNRYSIPPEEIPSAMEALLDETYQTLFQTINHIHSSLMKTPCGDVVVCNYSLDEFEINIDLLDRKYIGFKIFFLHLIQCRVEKGFIIEKIKQILKFYCIPNQMAWEPSVDYAVFQKAKEIYNELFRIVYQGGSIYA